MQLMPYLHKTLGWRRHTQQTINARMPTGATPSLEILWKELYRVLNSCTFTLMTCTQGCRLQLSSPQQLAAPPQMQQSISACDPKDVLQTHLLA